MGKGSVLGTPFLFGLADQNPDGAELTWSKRLLYVHPHLEG